MKKLLISIALFTLTSVVNAQGWTGDLVIEELWTEGVSDVIAFKTSGGQQYASGCLVNEWIFTADTEQRRSRTFSVALAAFTSGKKIQLWFKDDCANWSYHNATSIRVKN